jgi:hypothetical protein
MSCALASALTLAGCSVDREEAQEKRQTSLLECLSSSVWFDLPGPCHCADSEVEGASVCSSDGCREFNFLVLSGDGQSYNDLIRDDPTARQLYFPGAVLSRGPWELKEDVLVLELPTRDLATPVECDGDTMVRNGTTRYTRADSARALAIDDAVTSSDLPGTFSY